MTNNQDIPDSSSEQNEKIFHPGDLITGQFQVVRVLGSGGMGVVYEVIDRVTGQRLALKTIRSSRLARKGVVQAFLHEIALVRRFRHPNIIAVFDVRQDGPLLFYTMEFLEGVTLREILRQRGTLSFREIAIIIRPVCLALEHAHQFTVHRDVSPENIMTQREGVKLLDFGIARAMDPNAPHQRAVGKVFYSAPEMIDNSAQVDARADIYSLGVILYEALTGRLLPKPVKTELQLTDIPDAYRRIIARSAVDLDHRYRTVREFREALEQCAADSGGLSENLNDIHSFQQPETTNESTKRTVYRSIVWALVGLLGITLVFALIFAPVLTDWIQQNEHVPGEMVPPPEFVTRPQSIVTEDIPLPPIRSNVQISPWRSNGTEGILTLPGGTTMSFVRLRSGFFTMGDPSERTADASPARSIEISQRFWMGSHEVTQEQWFAVMGTRPWQGRPEALDDHRAPAVYVTWYDAQNYIDHLNNLNAGIFSLPTEAEWEYACRASTRGFYHFGDDENLLAEHAWYFSNTRARGLSYAQPVGQKQPNLWGLFDMHGNVAEWCASWYHSLYYRDMPEMDPTGPPSGQMCIVRGGSWADIARNMSTFRRDKEIPTMRRSTIGFRVRRDEE